MFILSKPKIYIHSICHWNGPGFALLGPFLGSGELDVHFANVELSLPALLPAESLTSPLEPLPLQQEPLCRKTVADVFFMDGHIPSNMGKVLLPLLFVLM